MVHFRGPEDLLPRFTIACPTSGRNSFTTLNPILLDIVIPKLTTPSPAECWLGGCQKRERKARPPPQSVGKQRHDAFRHRAGQEYRWLAHTVFAAKARSFQN